MAPAAASMRPLLDAVAARDADVPLIANVDARAITAAADIRQELIGQICGSVRWLDTVAAMSEAGVTTYYEVGPGKVLAGLIARCAPAATVVSAERLLTA